ncbi:hypothetical protein MRB53_038172 [Persea americana]|nr:hypothetical protein MRB53_038172 [Persea americana]
MRFFAHLNVLLALGSTAFAQSASSSLASLEPATSAVSNASFAVSNSTSSNSTELSQIVTELLDDLAGLTTCAACEAVLLVLKVLADLGDDAFDDVIIFICEALKIEEQAVCQGAVDLEGPPIAFSLRNMIIPSHTSQLFCVTIIGLCDYPAIVQFSDIHIDREYTTGSSYNCSYPICCRDYDASTAPGNTSYPCGPNGNYKCDAPKSLADSMYAAIDAIAPNASFALFTGDVPEHAVWVDDRDIVTVSLNDAYDDLHANLSLPLYATVGITTWAPSTAFRRRDLNGATSAQWAYDLLATQWSSWIGNVSADEAENYGAYSYKVPNLNLRVISLDTNFYYGSNYWLFQPVMEYDPDGQLSWLVNELQAAETAGERVYIIGHMPFGISDTFHDGSNYLDQIVNRYEATIAAMFFGHTHQDSFEISYSNYTNQNADTAVAISYICPSMTPTSGAPAFRVYSVDPVTLGVLDMTEYTASLENPSYQTTGPVWSEYYSSKAAYGSLIGVTDPTAELTPAFWHNVTAAFESDAAAFQAYYAPQNPRLRRETASDAATTSLEPCHYSVTGEVLRALAGSPDAVDQLRQEGPAAQLVEWGSLDEMKMP